ncbi:MAG TPA: L,D-transpeptidase [Xanthobacteraceae bacterium]
MTRSTRNQPVCWSRKLLLAAIISIAPLAPAHGLDMNSVNKAELPAKRERLGKGLVPAVIKAQVLLDRAYFSPGEIDGRLAENTRKAIGLFEDTHGLPRDGKLSPDVWSQLVATSGDPVLKEYRIEASDVKGPFLKELPSKMEAMSHLKHLSYTSSRQEIAEKFHMSQHLLKALNPGKPFDKSGDTIVVANVTDDPPAQKAARIEVDKAKRELRVFDEDGSLIFAAPATIGSAEKPAPSGTLKITSVTHNPTYRYNPAYHFKGVHANRPFTIRPGPNNPVGVVWIGLSRQGYGIHGTPDPSKVSKNASHGCIRLTNWDALMLAAMVKRGMPVAFLDDGHTS